MKSEEAEIEEAIGPDDGSAKWSLNKIQYLWDTFPRRLAESMKKEIEYDNRTV